MRLLHDVALLALLALLALVCMGPWVLALMAGYIPRLRRRS